MAYYLAAWQHVAWPTIGLLSIGVLIALPFWTGLVEDRSVPQEASTWSSELAIPIVLVGVLGAGILLTSATESPGRFESRLTAFAGEALPDAGYYRQAASVIAHLEATSGTQDSELQVAKGFVLSHLAHPQEAQAVLSAALDAELSEYTLTPRPAESSDRIARIYSYMGDVTSARRYWLDELDTFAASLIQADSPEARRELHMSRAHVYQALGEHDNAVTEYVMASTLAPTGMTKRDVTRGIARSLSSCRSGQLRAVPWSEVEAMSRALAHAAQGVRWCSPGPEEGADTQGA